MESHDRYTMQFLFRDRRPVAGFISGGSRAGKDSGAWVDMAVDKEKGKGKERRGRRRKCQANQRRGDRTSVGIKVETQDEIQNTE